MSSVENWMESQLGKQNEERFANNSRKKYQKIVGQLVRTFQQLPRIISKRKNLAINDAGKNYTQENGWQKKRKIV